MKPFEILFKRCSYVQALATQSELASVGKWGILLFCCPPTITMGKRATLSDVLLPETELRKLGLELIAVDRGGLVTFHGPGQLVGFPFGRLEDFTGDRRGVRVFVARLKTTLERFIAAELGPEVVDRSRPHDMAGVWTSENGVRTKIVSMGMGFGANGVRHGFSLNVVERRPGFELVNPCGETDAKPGWLCSSQAEYDGVVGRLTDWLALAWGQGASPRERSPNR